MRYKYYILKYVQNVSTSKENTAGTKTHCWYKVTLLVQSHKVTVYKVTAREVDAWSQVELEKEKEKVLREGQGK